MFHTMDRQIIATRDTHFRLRFNLTCAKSGCGVSPGEENYNFLLTSRTDSADRIVDVLADVDSVWTEVTSNNIVPGLGEGFSYRGNWKEIYLSGSFSVRAKDFVLRLLLYLEH